MMRCCSCSSFALLRLKDEIQTFLRDYDRLQYIAVILIYIQIGCALIGSLGALYNGVLLINLAIALFALVAIESSSQSLGRTYALLLFCAILLDISWFILFTHQIWSFSSDTYGVFFIFSIRLTLAMQIIGFSVRLSSSFLWIQIYRLGAPSREADFDLRNSFLSPTTTTTPAAAVPSDDAVGGSIYDPAYFSSLFEDAQENKFLLAPGGKPSTPSAFSMSLSASSSPMISSLSAPIFSFSTSSSSTSSSTTSFGGSLSSSKTTTDTKQTVTSTSMSLTSLSPIVSSSPLSVSLPTTSSSPIFSSSSFSASSTTAFSSSTCFTLQAPKTPVSLSTHSPSVKSIPESPKTELQLPTDKVNSNADASVTTRTPPVQLMFPVSESSSMLEPSVSSASAAGTPSELASGSQPSFTNIASAVSNAALNAQPEHSSTANTLFSTLLLTSASTTGGKNESLDIAVTLEDEMEEEAPETSHATELSLGSLGSFGIGSTQNPTAPKPNIFGCPFGNAATSPTSSPFTMTVPSGQLFRPASFSFQSPQSSQPSQPGAFSAFSGGFGTGTTAQPPTQSGFGQRAQIGQGQQALGSVLGSFGPSRQLGGGLPGAGFASASGFGGGFAPTSSTGGFSSAATGGGFAGVTSTVCGFAGLASAGGGFAAAASVSGGFAGLASGGFVGGVGSATSTGGSSSAATGGGFAGVTSMGSGFAGFASAGGGFAAAASGSGGFASVASTGGGFGGLASAGGGFAAAAPAGGGFTAAGGGFGAFSGQQGSGFGGGAGGTGKPPALFMEMRK